MNDRPSETNPVRLTYLITDLEVGGVPLHLYRLATRLPRDRFQVRVISLADIGPVGRQLQDAGIEVRACGARTWKDLAALGRAWMHFRDGRVDILHSLLFHANMVARTVGPLAGIPLSRILCEIQTAEQERRWHLLLDNLTCRLCRWEVGNSSSVVEHLHRQAHLPRSRLVCELGAVDVDRITSAQPIDRVTLGMQPGEKMILWTGRLDPVKGFEDMIPAMKEVRRTHSARLIIVGEGAYRPVIERLIRKQGLQNVVVLLGQRSDIPELLRTADVFLLASYTEGLPNSLLEAMAGELPVVATDVPGCRDLIQQGRTGLLVPPRSPLALAAAIRQVLDDHKLAGQLGHEARRWVDVSANLNQFAHRWIVRYEQILGTG